MRDRRRIESATSLAKTRFPQRPAVISRVDINRLAKSTSSLNSIPLRVWFLAARGGPDRLRPDSRNRRAAAELDRITQPRDDRAAQFLSEWRTPLLPNQQRGEISRKSAFQIACCSMDNNKRRCIVNSDITACWRLIQITTDLTCYIRLKYM